MERATYFQGIGEEPHWQRERSRKRWCKVTRTSERAEDSRSTLEFRENCKHNTKPTHTSHSRTRDFFVEWLKTLVIESIGIVVSLKKVTLYMLHSMSDAPPFVVSFTLEHHLTFHMHSSPTLYPTIYQTFIDVYFTLRFILRRSIKCVFRSPG